jgi:hypothetical protein
MPVIGGAPVFVNPIYSKMRKAGRNIHRATFGFGEIAIGAMPAVIFMMLKKKTTTNARTGVNAVAIAMVIN